MKWTLVSLLLVRDYFLHYFCQVLILFGVCFLIADLETRYSHGGLFTDLFGEEITRAQIDGYSMPLVIGVIILLFTVIIYFGLSGKLRVRKNENEEISVTANSIFGRTDVTPLGRVEFRRKQGISIYRRVIILSAIFYDAEGNPKLVVKEHSNKLFVVDRYYVEGGKRIPFNVPKKFGNVRTLQQVWSEHKLF